jgi:hypothetical protein
MMERPLEEEIVTLIWFVVWLVSNFVGDKESLVFDPVNGWAATLILAVAIDLARQHAPERRTPKDRAESQP